MLLALLAFRNSLRILEVSQTTRWFMLIAAGFASMLNPFLTTLNNHTPGAICLLFSLAALIRLKASAEPRPRDFALVGLFAALTCCFELPAALYGLLPFVVVVLVDWRKTAKYYVPAALIPLAAFFVTNWICTGGIKPFYTYYGTDKYVFVHEGVPSYWSEPQGIDANQESTPVYLFHCVLGHHGLLSLTPVFVLTLIGWAIAFRSNKLAAARTVMSLGAGISCAVLFFYLTRTQNYSYGGNSSALRWMLWLTPFWWYGMLPAVERLSQRKTGIFVLLLVLVPSIYSPLYSLTKPWRPSWLYTEMESAGLIDYRTKIQPFNPTRYTVINAIPTTPGTTTSYKASGPTATEFRLTTGSSVQIGNSSATRLMLEANGLPDIPDRQPNRIELFVLNGGPTTGQDISKWLRVHKSADTINEEELERAPRWVENLLRGMPSARAYNAASPRYFQYIDADGQKTAIKCERAASRVAFDHPKHDRCWQRCDVLYSDQLPFGVAKWKTTVTQDGTNKVISTREWTCQQLP